MVRAIASHQAVSLERIGVTAGDLHGEALKRAMAIEARRRFVLDTPPLFRAQLFCHDNRELAFLFTVHHLLFDPASYQVCCREIGALYRRLSTGQEAMLPALECSYDDYVTRQQLRATQSALARWRQRVLRPDGGPPRAFANGECDMRVFAIDADGVRRLRAAAAARRVTFATLLLGGYVMMAAKVLDLARVTVGIPIIDRRQAELKHLIGLFMNVLVVPVDARADNAVPLVDRVRRAFHEALQDQDVPYGFCARGHSAPFDCTFDFIAAQECALALEGVDTETVSVSGEFLLRSAMALHVAETCGTLRCTLLFRSDGMPRFSAPELVDELTRCFDTIAAAATPS